MWRALSSPLVALVIFICCGVSWGAHWVIQLGLTTAANNFLTTLAGVQITPVKASGATQTFQSYWGTYNLADYADCTGTTDGTSALQTLFTNAPNASLFWLPNAAGSAAPCRIKIGTGTATYSVSTVSYNSGTGIVTLTFASGPNVSVGQTFVVIGVTGITGGTINGPQVAVSGTSGTTVEYQAATGLGGTAANGSLQNCALTVSGKNGFKITGLEKAIDANAPGFVWNGTGGIAFCVVSSDHPWIDGISGTVSSGQSLDGWVIADGPDIVGSTPTLFTATNNEFSAPAVANPNFIAISISATSQVNNENSFIWNNEIYCSAYTASRPSITGSITNGTNTLNVPGGSFTGGNIGDTILVSTAAGALATTISSVSDSTDVVLAANWTLSTAVSNATVHVGQPLPSGGSGFYGSYGIGIFQGTSPNAKHSKIWNNRISDCHIEYDMSGGSWDIESPEGGSSDLGLSAGTYTEPSTFNYMADEHDVQAMLFGGNQFLPFEIRNLRIENSNQRADGWIQSTGGIDLTIENSLLQSSGIQTNAVFYNLPSAKVVDINNTYSKANNGALGMTFAQVNLVSAVRAEYIGDLFNGTSGNQISGWTGTTGLQTSCTGLPTGAMINSSNAVQVCP